MRKSRDTGHDLIVPFLPQRGNGCHGFAWYRAGAGKNKAPGQTVIKKDIYEEFNY